MGIFFMLSNGKRNIYSDFVDVLWIVECPKGGQKIRSQT